MFRGKIERVRERARERLRPEGGERAGTCTQDGMQNQNHVRLWGVVVIRYRLPVSRRIVA
jgi:hypothetical protein